MRKIVNNVKRFVSLHANKFSVVFPTKKGRWVYGAWSGQLFADNSKYLFEYVTKSHPEIESVWITRNRDVCKEVKKRGYKCYLRTSLSGMIAAATAEVAFITSDELFDISPLVNRNRTKVIELWHGIAGKAARWKDKNGVLAFSGAELKRYSSYYWTASSEKYIDVMNEATSAPKERFIVTGYPRNDTFVHKPQNTNMERLKNNNPDAKFIIYMPTHRNFGKESISVDEFYWLDKKLRENNIIMVYKPHFHELKNVLHLESEFSNIILAKEQEVWGDVYAYIHYFDLLISDYSSIAYDFLCADKPIVLYTYDLNHFRNEDAGLWDFFEEVPAGPFCFSWDEVMKCVINLLAEDTWKEKRAICRNMFHPFCDGKNSERVYDAVINDFIRRE